MEAQATLIRANRTVELNPIACISPYLSGIIHPGHAESENTVGFDHPFDNLRLFEFGMLVIDIFYRLQNFADGLKILALSGILFLETGHKVKCVHNKNYCCSEEYALHVFL